MRNRKRFVRAVALFLAGLMLFSLIFAALGSIFASAASQSQIDALEKEKAALRAEKASAGNAAAKLRKERASYEEQKRALDEKNRIAQEEIVNTKEQIEIYGEMIVEKQAEADEAQAAADAQLARYKQHLRAMEENGTYNFYLSVLFGAENFGELISRIDMITEIMENDKQVEKEYKDSRDVALQAKTELEEVQNELEVKKGELEAESAEFQKGIEETNALIAELQADINAYNAMYNAALASEQRVQKEINQLQAQLEAEEEERRKQEEAQQQQQEQQGGGSSSGESSSGDSSSGGSGSGGSASTSTGSFIWPAPASRYITSRYGERVHPIYGTVKFHSGIDIGAAAGTNVLAADGGTVTTATVGDPGYGNYVMIRHSGGRVTLYAHMSSLAVSSGQTVSQGQVVGYVGSTGAATGPHLHFEVFVNGGRVDPLSYFSGYTLSPTA